VGGTSVSRAASRGGAAGLVLVAMTLANAMILVDQTAVPITLPAIMNGFHVGSQKAQWVLNGSLLPLAGLLVLGGKLGDLLGRRRVFIVGAVTFAGASAVGGLAPVFPMLLAARVLQGAGGALMLPTSVAIVSAAFAPEQRGRALGTMGGAAAVAGALGPTIGGVLTSAISWRAVLLVNTPLAVLCLLATVRSVAPDEPARERAHVDVLGASLICIALVGITFGLSQTQLASWGSASVVLPLAVGALATIALVVNERRAATPLLDFRLLSRHHNYLAGTVSQGLAGLAEMGLSVIFPLVLILNLGMTPALAGLALLPSTVPMIVVSPMAGRWYDRVGGRRPLVVGFATLAAAGIALALGIHEPQSYLKLLPGLLLFGIGLALVLTINDPVCLDTVVERDHGQASGVSATAEQGGGAIGIAVCYTLFHSAYVNRLHQLVDRSSLPDLSDRQYEALRHGLLHAESTGLRASQFNPKLVNYLDPAQAASGHGYAIAFLTVTVASIIGLAVVAAFVRRPPVRLPPHVAVVADA
jgi:EmrB/QacA subfamily drug resistance transporter